ncbi:thiamine phosphate synthase [Phytoactinopolyspora mesophila]|uniref:Thiamine-phosphate synthase n=1 Tax=Phytoactinopolyspora mesophila TaxID=2650750 RepID=A0A7K3MC62_9ACTN|nr:thiamine phosphate synthase [Phytoactinopolyspora mesophila]NDL60856.1 thiamine phosphate synthase [Phytoactinopolyspora mesophila]
MRGTLDVRLYVVTEPSLTPPPRLIESCLAAVRGGATLVQLRDKQATDDELLLRAAQLRDVLQPHGVPLVVNDRLDVARKVGIGVHVGVHDVAPVVAREVLGPAAVVGWSVEDPERMPPEQLAASSYLAASPVWVTPTKTDTAHPLGPPGVAAIRRATDLPLVGIGGINSPERAAEVIRAGADGVAVVSAVFGADDPQAAAARLRAAVDEALRGATP